MEKIFSAGKRGASVRSDCYIEIKQKTKKGNTVQVVSKVDALYGNSIRELIKKLIAFFELDRHSVVVEDSGALPFVIAARFEAAVKRMYPNCKKNFLLKTNKAGKKQATNKDRLRCSRLYLPGNEPKFFLNAGLHKPDGVILDLEDSVAPSEKDAARYLVRNALVAVDFYGCEKMVRINQLPLGLIDLEAVIGHGVEVILIPKCETVEQVRSVDEKIAQICKAKRINDDILLMPIIESALGILNAQQIATASKRICALTIGLEDYTADIGTQRTLEGRESFFARSMVVNAAKAARVQAIDTVFSDVSDMEGLRQSVLEAKSLGFEGKGVIHPRQIPVVHEAFTPTSEEIEKAQKIVTAFNEAKEKGLSVISIGSKMIDPPVVLRALRIIELTQKQN